MGAVENYVPEHPYPIHPAVNLFPLMGAEDLARLTASIKKHGLRHPIVLFCGGILDGRNRLAGCRAAEVEPVFRDFDGDADGAVDYVLDVNAERRHLTPAQRAAIAVEAISLYSAAARKKMGAGGGDRRSEKSRSGGTDHVPPDRRDPAGRTLARAAKGAGAAREATEKMASVAKKDPAVAAVVKAGKGTVADAERTAKLPQPERVAVVERVTSGESATLKEALAARPASDELCRDAIGRVLSDEIAEAFAASVELHEQAANLITRAVGAIAKLPALGRVREAVQLAGHEIRSDSPCTTCVHCKLIPGRRETCEACRGKGWSTAMQFKSAIEPLKIGGAEAVVFSLEVDGSGERSFVRVADVLAGKAR